MIKYLINWFFIFKLKNVDIVRKHEKG